MRMPEVGDVVVCKYLDIRHPNAAWMCTDIADRESRPMESARGSGSYGEDSGIYKHLIFEFRRATKKDGEELPKFYARKIFGYEVEGMIALDAMRIVDISSYIFKREDKL